MLAKWNPFSNSGIARPSSAQPGFDDFFAEADRLFSTALGAPYLPGISVKVRG